MGDAATAYDLILVGAGLANGLIALRLRERRPELRILMLEQGAQAGGNHTWSFHDSDLTTEQNDWIAPLVSHRWPSYDVVFPELKRTLYGGYASIESRDFARVLAPTMADALRTGVTITALSPTQVTLADGQTLHARAVIDGRGMRASSHLALGYQTFLGQEVRLAAPHGLNGPTIMDASVAQQGGYRFVYLLPFGPDRVLIEDTHYVDSAAWEPQRLRANIGAYAAARGWQIAEIVREEQGSLPIVLAGDFERFWDELEGVPTVGLRAGLFHATTGYSLPHAVRLAEHIAGLPDVSAPSLFAAVRDHARQEWQTQGFFRMLNRMLFLAGSPDNRWRVMQRFYRLHARLIKRFYAAELTFADKARLLTGKPPVPVLEAFTAVRKTHPYQIRKAA